jgi:predicted AlkP superfamily phosphohydrolase/phosphomutase
MPRRRQLLIGIDSAEWTLVERLAAQGRLPNLRRCLQAGTRAVLPSPAARFTDAVWPAIHASANPARIEKYFDLQLDAATQELRPLSDEVISNRPFWERLGEAGLRVGVFDAPKFPTCRELNGFQVGNWGACSTKTARASTPAGLLADIDARFARHPVDSCHSFRNSVAGHRALYAALLEGVRRRGEVARWLMQSQPCDVFFLTFSETHCAGHHLWHYLDPTHHLYPGGDIHALAGAIGHVYEAVDREIGTLFPLAGDDAYRIVFSGLGMGPLRHTSSFLGQMVELLGYGDPRAGRPGRQAAGRNVVERVKSRIPIPLQLRIKALFPRALQERIHAFGYTGRRRWKNARAFAVPNNIAVGAIRINLKGRDGFGCVEPGPPYESLCREIAGAMRELRDPESGRRVAREVTITREAFAGPYLDLLPDITVAWDQSFAWTQVQSPQLGTLSVEAPDAPSGSHTPYGFVILNGPGIAADRVVTGYTTYDIAPTVLSLAGFAPGGDLEGRPIETGAIPAAVASS